MKLCEIIQGELEALSSGKTREMQYRFFKTGEGEYGEGDEFVGVTVPVTRGVARGHLDASLRDIEDLLDSPLHEVRLCGLMIMVENCKRSTSKSWLKEHSEMEGEELRKAYFDFYLTHTGRVNNWDLVDLSAYNIVGEWLLDKPRDILYVLADSESPWRRRMAVVATFAFIKRGDLVDTFAISERLLFHPHDLTRKAVGWMLREAGKRDRNTLVAFLDRHAAEMPRTTLRYAIEKFDEPGRQYYLRMWR